MIQTSGYTKRTIVGTVNLFLGNACLSFVSRESPGGERNLAYGKTITR
jgi:hypothetical protein